MKKWIALSMALAVLPTVAMAKGNHPMAGCGLAYVLFSSKDNSKPIQVLAGTTNNLWGTQTFGITSGTSGCTEDGAVKFVKEAELYAEINLKNLQQEMAAGEGEYLSSFSKLVGVSATQQASFNKLVQEKYSSIFPSANTSSTDMLSNLSQQLSAHPELLS